MLSTLLAEAAQANGIDLSSIMPAISAVGSLGFAIWFAYYTTTVTLPNQQKEHRDERDKRDQLHYDTIKGLIAELKDARDSFDRWRSAK